MATKKPSTKKSEKVIDAEVFRPPSSDEMKIALDRRGFLAMSHVPGTAKLKALKDAESYNDPDIAYPISIPTECDWTLHYYPLKDKEPTHVVVSMGEELFGWTGRDDMNTDALKQTYQWQSVNTAIETINFCLQQGWKAFRIDDGTDLMKWAAWAYLDALGKGGDTGYKPTAHDKLRAKNCADLFNVAQKSFEKSKTISPMGSVDSHEDDEG